MEMQGQCGGGTLPSRNVLFQFLELIFFFQFYLGIIEVCETLHKVYNLIHFDIYIYLSITVLKINISIMLPPKFPHAPL